MRFWAQSFSHFNCQLHHLRSKDVHPDLCNCPSRNKGFGWPGCGPSPYPISTVNTTTYVVKMYTLTSVTAQSETVWLARLWVQSKLHTNCQHHHLRSKDVHPDLCNCPSRNKGFGRPGCRPSPYPISTVNTTTYVVKMYTLTSVTAQSETVWLARLSVEMGEGLGPEPRQPTLLFLAGQLLGSRCTSLTRKWLYFQLVWSL